MRTFDLFWLDGKTERIKGHYILDAITKSGYSEGALSALDYYTEVTEMPIDEKTVYLDNDEICNPLIISQLREFAKNNSCDSVVTINYANSTVKFTLSKHTGTEIYYEVTGD